MKPHVPEQSIIPSLIQEQLAISPQTWVDLSVLVQIRSKRPATSVAVKIEYSALPNVDE